MSFSTPIDKMLTFSSYHSSESFTSCTIYSSFTILSSSCVMKMITIDGSFPQNPVCFPRNKKTQGQIRKSLHHKYTFDKMISSAAFRLLKKNQFTWKIRVSGLYFDSRNTLYKEMWI